MYTVAVVVTDELVELDELEDEDPEELDELEKPDDPDVVDDPVEAATTATLHLYFFPSTVAVIVVVPAAFAFTLPVLLTVATLFLEEVHVTSSVVSLILSFCVSPTVRVNSVSLIEGVTTLTLHLYFAPFTVAVMVVGPFALAVTLPFEFTVATSVLLDDHFTVSSVPVIVSLSFCPLISVAVIWRK